MTLSKSLRQPLFGLATIASLAGCCDSNEQYLLNRAYIEKHRPAAEHIVWSPARSDASPHNPVHYAIVSSCTLENYGLDPKEHIPIRE